MCVLDCHDLSATDREMETAEGCKGDRLILVSRRFMARECVLRMARVNQLILAAWITIAWRQVPQHVRSTLVGLESATNGNKTVLRSPEEVSVQSKPDFCSCNLRLLAAARSPCVLPNPSSYLAVPGNIGPFLQA